MRVFVAGAAGVVGIPLMKELVAAGHAVAGMTRSWSKVDLLRQLGVEPVVCDVYDAEALTAAVAAFRPDAIVHELTDLPDDAGQLGEFRQANSRIRQEGTRNLLAARHAAAAASARRRRGSTNRSAARRGQRHRRRHRRRIARAVPDDVYRGHAAHRRSLHWDYVSHGTSISR